MEYWLPSKISSTELLKRQFASLVSILSIFKKIANRRNNKRITRNYIIQTFTNVTIIKCRIHEWKG